MDLVAEGDGLGRGGSLTATLEGRESEGDEE